MRTSALERDDFSSNRHPAVALCWSMIFFRKPVSTFRDHALALVLAAAASASALANDTTAELATGGLIFVRNENVEMLSEDLAISAKEIGVRYRFFNKSDQDVTVLVAFPMPDIKIE